MTFAIVSGRSWKIALEMIEFKGAAQFSHVDVFFDVFSRALLLPSVPKLLLLSSLLLHSLALFCFSLSRKSDSTISILRRQE